MDSGLFEFLALSRRYSLVSAIERSVALQVAATAVVLDLCAAIKLRGQRTDQSVSRHDCGWWAATSSQQKSGRTPASVG
jgi:hypothetical protein